MDFKPDSVTHSSYLPVFALVNGYVKNRFSVFLCMYLDLRRLCYISVVKRYAVAERIQLFVRRVALDRYSVCFFYLMRRMSKFLRGLAVICQKQQSFRVSVQSSYGVNASLYSSDKVCHNASVVLCFHGCYNASRLVKDKISLVRNFQMQSVSVAENAVSFRVNVLTDYCRFFVDKDLALTDKFLSRTP